MKEIKIGNNSKIIGPDHPLFMIAEVGVTCNYDLSISKELIDLVKDAGADAIKFIFWFPREILSDHSVTYTYKSGDGQSVTENLLQMLEKLRFDLPQWQELKRYADSKGVTFFATVNSPSGLELSVKLGVEAYKLSSWDYNYFPLWKDIAAQGKPMLIDTGPVNLVDVAKVVQVMRDVGNDQAVLIHCFHTEAHNEMNMRAIPYMASTFDVLTGFSSTGREIDVDIMAVSLGASVLEKRVTMSRKLPGHHHILSKEPEEFRQYVREMRNVHAALGEFALKPSKKDVADREKNFRKIVANCNIRSGETISRAMLECKRPATGGISPEFFDLFVGRIAKRDISENEALQWNDI